LDFQTQAALVFHAMITKNRNILNFAILKIDGGFLLFLEVGFVRVEGDHFGPVPVANVDGYPQLWVDMPG